MSDEQITVNRARLAQLVEAAQSYASSTCQEFCAHSVDPPEKCPMNNPVIAEFAALLAED